MTTIVQEINNLKANHYILHNLLQSVENLADFEIVDDAHDANYDEVIQTLDVVASIYKIRRYVSEVTA